MKLRSRAVRLAGRASLVVTIMVGLLYAASLRWYVNYTWRESRASAHPTMNRAIGVSGGMLGIAWWDLWRYQRRMGWAAGKHDGAVWAWFRRWRRPYDYVGIPMWAPVGVAAMPWAAVALRDTRRRRRGWCTMCGYDLAGLPRGDGAVVCPECGVRAEISRNIASRLA